MKFPDWKNKETNSGRSLKSMSIFEKKGTAQNLWEQRTEKAGKEEKQI